VYSIALSVAACLRGGTRVDVAWNLDPDRAPAFDPTDAVAITPGGGRLGRLFDGALDSRLVELSLLEATEGRIVEVEVNEIEAAAIGVAAATTLRIFFAPADTLPSELWDRLLERAPITLDIELADGRAVSARLGEAPNTSAVRVDDDRIVCAWAPTATLIVYGGGPMAEALSGAAGFVGWKVERTDGTEAAVALATSLSPIDGIVVMGHDTEGVGRVLETALGSGAGYIGSLGPATLQQDRAEWLAYRDVTDTSRVHGPAGFDVGARTPEEVAVSIVVEMIAVRNAVTA
jgi:xanthine dehydrogenase accessory factor